MYSEIKNFQIILQNWKVLVPWAAVLTPYFVREKSIIIDYIYSKIRVSIKNGDKFSEEFVTSTGVPQGCPLSPLMYILFASDMKDWLTHKGVSLENLQLQFIQYADDML